MYRDRVQLNMSWNEPFVGKEVMARRGPAPSPLPFPRPSSSSPPAATKPTRAFARAPQVFTPRENGAVLHVHCQVQLRSGAHAAYTHIYVRKTPMRTH